MTDTSTNKLLPQQQIPLADEAATLAIGRQFGSAAAACKEGLTVHLHGDLGAGKTTLARGFLRAFGYEGAVKSPTYTLVEPYTLTGRHIFHFDLYRLTNPNEMDFLGVEEYLRPPNICLIEWAERGEKLIPAADLRLELTVSGSARILHCEAKSAVGATICQKF
ncbi:MAG: tRNA (adenosine(37)-N6)-threonylcarbamoyltransferase complex ATPase subunit type 1 TsaE [Pseudohongiellaceae bacterium]